MLLCPLPLPTVVLLSLPRRSLPLARPLSSLFPAFPQIARPSSPQRHFRSSEKSIPARSFKFQRNLCTRKMSTLNWTPPCPESPALRLKINNSLTRRRDEFVPLEGNFVGWYCCGPTVYDASHMGHARAYITFDILRRIMTDYFGYNVCYVMNITDIDDKIILGARYSHLFTKFVSQDSLSMSDSQIQFLIKEAIIGYAADKLKKAMALVSSMENVESLLKSFEDVSSESYIKARDSVGEKFTLHLITLNRAVTALNSSTVSRKDLFFASKDVLSLHLDALHGQSVTDPKIFRDFSAHWENDYFKDMDALGIRRPDVLTRVSEYVEEIVTYVQKIMDNGYAYESASSVYFSTTKFDSAPGHHYCKLEPWSKGNTSLLTEGEGSLATQNGGKTHPNDFALWKASRPGEPAWNSPWGPGRPGWHIECSAMAHAILGDKLDVHSGGIDLAFPHHDNEIAQAEAHADSDQWVNYFMHAGHLHIEGSKMSKSLKNFITIKDALDTYTAKQIRIMFLLHQWDKVLDYKEESMREAISWETSMNNFLQITSALLLEREHSPSPFTGRNNFQGFEADLLSSVKKSQEQFHAALCDSFNTTEAMNALTNLVRDVNLHLGEKIKAKEDVNEWLLGMVRGWIVKSLGVFGLGEEVGSRNTQRFLMPYLRVLSGLRDKLRESAKSKASHDDIAVFVQQTLEDARANLNIEFEIATNGVKTGETPVVKLLKRFLSDIQGIVIRKGKHVELLQACDSLRDDHLVDLGVVLDDREDGIALIKFADRDVLLKQREDKKNAEAEKEAMKIESKLKAAETRLERARKGSVKPSELFTGDVGKTLYSAWDSNGLPTHDVTGEEVAKGRKKKLQKEYDVQVKAHEEYKEFLRKGGELTVDWVLKNT